MEPLQDSKTHYKIGNAYLSKEDFLNELEAYGFSEEEALKYLEDIETKNK